ncbi:MAG: hypothetical protein RLZZ584_4417 [Pseudomonadota bacterium]|jgi:hypothetical protein
MATLAQRLERLESKRAPGPVVFMRRPDGGMHVMGTHGFRARLEAESLEAYSLAAESAGRQVVVIRLVAGGPGP